MKFRFRNYARKGWEVVEVPRANLYNWQLAGNEQFGNREHYQEICTWCAKTFPDGTWVSTVHPTNTMTEVGSKRFAFKHSKHATLFKLKWA